MYDAFPEWKSAGTKGVNGWQCEIAKCSALVVSVRMWWKLLHAVELEALHL